MTDPTSTAWAWCDACERDTDRHSDGRCGQCKRESARAAYVRLRDERKKPRWCGVCEAVTNRTAGGTCKPCNNASHRARYDREMSDPEYRAAYNERTRLRVRQPEYRTRALQANARRRARKLDALVHDVTDAMVWEFNPAGPGCCNYCRKPLAFDDRKAWQVDHVIPLVRGGLHEIGNLVIACPSCNHSKKDKTPAEWRARRAT